MWEAEQKEENKGQAEDVEIDFDRAALLCKNFHLPEKILRKCRGPDHRLIFELVLVEAATHFHKMISDDCPEVTPALALMADIQKNLI